MARRARQKCRLLKSLLVGGLLLAPIGCKKDSPTAPIGDVTEIFPIAVGSRWVYDYTYHNSSQDNLTYSKTHDWQQGAITFSVQSVIDELSQLRWTVRERDSLHYTTYYLNYLGDTTHYADSTRIREFPFSILEGKGSLHQLESSSSSVLWLSPVYGQMGAVLSRYVPGSLESYLIHRNDTLSVMPFQLQTDSLLFARDKGLVRYTNSWVWATSMTRSTAEYSATLREYTPGPGAVVGGAVRLGRDKLGR